jgi:membrane protein DedA with SNARE-associated domain
VFALWSIVGSTLWTPTIVLLTAWLGDAFAENLKSAAGHAFLPSILAAVLVLGLLYLLRVALSDDRRGAR